MTWQFFVLLLVLLLQQPSFSKPPFIDLNEVHQAYSEFEVNLILNENRNYPIILTSVSNDDAKSAAKDILQQALNQQPDSSFALLIDCKDFQWDLNKTLGICRNYEKGQQIPEGSDPHFMCQFMHPDPVRIKEKGHIVTKNHQIIYLSQSKNFNGNYLAEMLKSHISDLVQYIEDEYDLEEFLEGRSEFKVSKQAKLLYFDDNLLSPLFLKKLASILDGRVQIGVTDDPTIVKKFGGSFGDLILLEYDFEERKYRHSQIEFDPENPIQSIKEDDSIIHYYEVKKSRDMMLDFEHKEPSIYNFSTIHQVNNLISHGRMILLEVSQESCQTLKQSAKPYDTLFNYVCFSKEKAAQIQKFISFSVDDQILLIIDSLSSAKPVPKNTENLYAFMPQTVSRQRVSTDTEADHCIRTALASHRDPIFFYFHEKTHKDQISLMNYFNSQSQVTSLLYFCQIYLPTQDLVRKFSLKPNILFTLFDPDQNGNMKKLEHSSVSNFLEIKMFLREISIQQMMKAYEDKIINNKVEVIESAQMLTENCFNSKCIIGLIASGRYREDIEINILQEIKLTFAEQGYKVFWMDVICHWEVAKQLKLLKKKEKIVEQSNVLMYREKDTAYSLWKTGKFWDKKELIRWVKSLRNNKNVKNLRFGIDVEEKVCERKEKSKESEDL